MTIKTLRFIHDLLVRQEQMDNSVYVAARDLQYEYELTEVDDEFESDHKALVDRQTAAANEYMRVHLASLAALNEFESYDWS